MDCLRLLLWGEGHAKIADPDPLPLHASHPLIRDGKTRFWVDPWPWIDYLRDTDFAFGTRIHGNIAALLAGTPAFVLGHDTRTTELARYFDIPYREMTNVPPDTDAADLYAEADYGPMIAGHPARFATFTTFIERHGLKHVFQPGEDPAEFDRRIARIEFPPTVELYSGSSHAAPVARGAARRQERRPAGPKRVPGRVEAGWARQGCRRREVGRGVQPLTRGRGAGPDGPVIAGGAVTGGLGVDPGAGGSTEVTCGAGAAPATCLACSSAISACRGRSAARPAPVASRDREQRTEDQGHADGGDREDGLD